MSLELPFGVKTLTQKPEIAKYFNQAGVPYTNTAEVLTELTAGIRHRGLTVNVAGVEYWFKDGILDVNLVVKAEGGVSLIRQEFTFSGSQIFTLSSNYSQVYSVEVQGQGALSLSQYDLIAPNQVEILDTLDTGDYIVVIYSANTGGVVPFYTQAQVDALIAGIVIPPPSKIILSKSVVDSTVVTGTTANVFPYSITIPANTVRVGDIVSFRGRLRKTGTNGVVSFRCGDAGEPLLAFCQTSAASQGLLEMSRDFVIKSATDTEALSVATNGFTSEGAYNQKISYNIDWTIDQTVSIGLTLQNASDSALISYYEIYIS
jgi:hypothetical protein